MPGQSGRCLLDSKVTGGFFSLMEGVFDPGAEVPLHIHHREDETFHVLEGTLRVRCGERTEEIGVGGTAFLPRNIPHQVGNSGKIPVRVMILITPGGFEGFFEELGRLARAGALDPAKFASIAQSYEVEFVRD